MLVLEDDEELRQAWVEALAAEGYAPVAGTDAAQALAQVTELAPDLILLDLVLPGEMNGFEFLARLRATPGVAQIPVLIVSALGEELERAMDRRGRTALGVAGIVPKPVDVPTLIGAVRQAIGPPR